MDTPVCFHGRDRCFFCWLAGRPPAIVVPEATCHACGGRIDAPGAECPRCVLIDAEAMLLPLV